MAQASKCYPVLSLVASLGTVRESQFIRHMEPGAFLARFPSLVRTQPELLCKSWWNTWVLDGVTDPGMARRASGAIYSCIVTITAAVWHLASGIYAVGFLGRWG